MDNISVEIGVAVVAVLTSLAGWFKSHSELNSVIKDREATKSQRDQDSQQLHDKVIGLEFKCTALKENTALLFTKYDDLASQLRLLVVELTKLSTELSNTNKQLQTFQSRDKQ